MLSLNSLTLDLSPDWIPPFHLYTLYLASCQIAHGSFPTRLRTQSDLMYLDISVAGISGEVPNWSNLQVLNLSHNQIWGTIPDLSFSSSMTYLDVGSNNLSAPYHFLIQESRFSSSLLTCSLDPFPLYVHMSFAR